MTSETTGAGPRRTDDPDQLRRLIHRKLVKRRPASVLVSGEETHPLRPLVVQRAPRSARARSHTMLFGYLPLGGSFEPARPPVEASPAGASAERSWPFGVRGRPGGTLAILEFSQPPDPMFAKAYDLYSRHVLPRIGAAISGASDAYTYLPESVRKFPGAEGLARMIEAAGFREVRYRRMTFGIVALHTGIAG